MIEWIINIFDSPADKARFVTVVFSAIIAVFILLLNQFFINKREKRQIYVTKLEEIYQNILEFQKKGALFLSNSNWHLEDDDLYKEKDLLQEASNAAQTITMLLELYFPNETIAFEEISKIISTLRYRLDYNEKEGDSSFATYMKVHDEFENRVQKLKDTCKEISKKLK